MALCTGNKWQDHHRGIERDSSRWDKLFRQGSKWIVYHRGQKKKNTRARRKMHWFSCIISCQIGKGWESMDPRKGCVGFLEGWWTRDDLKWP